MPFGLWSAWGPAMVGVALVVGGIVWLRLHAAVALLTAAAAVSLLTPAENVRAALLANVRAPSSAKLAEAAHMASATVGERLSSAFGSAAGQIGLVVIFACIVGEALRVTGAARVIAQTILRATGPRHAAWGLAGASFALGVPVFFDTLFLLMVPLARALRTQTGRDYLLYILAVVAGGTMAHALVPPTPGPLIVAEALGVNLTTMILGGLITGAVAAIAGLLFAYRLNARITIPLRAGLAGEDQPPSSPELATHRSLSVVLAALPVVLPLLLLAGGAMTKTPWMPASLSRILVVIGNKNIALGLGAAAALALVARQQGGHSAMGRVVQQGVAAAGPIVLITAAGGCFGEMLRQTNIGAAFVQNAGATLSLLPLAALVTTAVRTAQGSATVAMMTAVGMVAGVASHAQLPFHPVYLALAIGCGSKNFAWMNDSGFWVMSRTTGMTEAETLRTVSVMNLVMAAAGLTVVMLGAWLLPLTP